MRPTAYHACVFLLCVFLISITKCHFSFLSTKKIFKLLLAFSYRDVLNRIDFANNRATGWLLTIFSLIKFYIFAVSILKLNSIIYSDYLGFPVPTATESNRSGLVTKRFFMFAVCNLKLNIKENFF
jgi:hypothetical protein